MQLWYLLNLQMYNMYILHVLMKQEKASETDLIIFTEDVPPLRVTQNDPLTSHVLDHGRAETHIIYTHT